jgi:ligand-binding sensor domain-containing protein/signal transduction histidine kinase
MVAAQTIRGVLLGATLVSAALALAPPQSTLDGYGRRVWQSADGLPENTVQALAQTRDHYLWIGTTGGLVRFDGVHFTVFDRESTPALGENSVYTLLAASDGALWIGTEGAGLVRYKDGFFQSFSEKEGLTNPFVRVVFEDSQGTVWVGTDRGLFRIRGGRLVRVDGQSGIRSIAVHTIREDREGGLWVGGERLIRLSGGKAALIHFPGGLGENTVRSVLEASDGTTWVGTVAGLQRLTRTPSGVGFVSKKIDGIETTVQALRESRDGGLWAATVGGGLIRYRDGAFSRQTSPAVLPSNVVLALYEDEERNLWVGTHAGLVRFSQTPIAMLPFPDSLDSVVGTVYADRDGSIWIAGPHLYHSDGRAIVPAALPSLAGVSVRNVFRDSQGTLWLGTKTGAVRIRGNRVFRYTMENGLINDFVRAFAEDSTGGIWIGTDSGLSRWSPNGFTSFHTRNGLAYGSVRTLLIDHNGDLWVGTERGPSHMRAGAFVNDAPVRLLAGEKIWTIHEDSDGGLWFGTRAGGLYRWKNARLSHFTTREGLASNSISQILEDARGDLWMSGPTYISSVPRSELDRSADSPPYHPAVTFYDISDTMESSQLNGGIQPAGCITSKGEIWFAGSKGPVRVTPDGPRSAPAPPVAIERVVADGQDVPGSGNLNLGPGEGKLEIHYTAVRLKAQARIRFKYLLEGFDRDWTEAGSRRAAYYTNLPPGRYRFRVMAFDMETPGSTAEAALGLYWRPYFYQTTWSLACAMVLAGALAWAAHRGRVRRIRSRYQGILLERNRVAREMHDTLIQGCAGVSALLEAASCVNGSSPETSRDLLDRARTHVRETMDEARRAVWDLRHTVPASGIAAALAEEAGRTQRDTGIPVRYEPSGSPFPVPGHIEAELLSIAREALRNAVRHAHPRTLCLRLHFARRKVHMDISDDGCGFAVGQNATDRYGITGMRERVETLGGKFLVESQPGAGSHIAVTVAVNRSVANSKWVHRL